MQEVLLTILQAVITVAVPIITVAVCSFLKTKAQEAASKTDNSTVAKYITEVATAVTTAVTYTSQTYVDKLKASGTFTPENQKEALQTALETAISILSVEAQEFLTEAYGDLNAYLTTKIEAEVRDQKLEFSAIESTTDGSVQ